MSLLERPEVTKVDDKTYAVKVGEENYKAIDQGPALGWCLYDAGTPNLDLVQMGGMGPAAGFTTPEAAIGVVLS